MIKIAIVEDDDNDAELLTRLLGEYAAARAHNFSVARYADPQRFFDESDSEPDIVFFDICMPGLSGMDAARKLRERHSKVIIVFVTNMMQYAVEGYSVQASDFIVKPANAASVSRVMDRVTVLADNNSDKTIRVKDAVSGSISMLRVGDIYYVEVSLHRLTWHTSAGNIADWGTLDSVQSKLPTKVFSRCHVSYLVNLEHVKEVKKDQVTVGNDVLPVSRSQKKKFYADLATYLGERRK